MPTMVWLGPLKTEESFGLIAQKLVDGDMGIGCMQSYPAALDR